MILMFSGGKDDRCLLMKYPAELKSCSFHIFFYFLNQNLTIKIYIFTF